MKIFLLLLLVGISSGLQYPLQYVYHYKAKVSSGIPDINKKHSAINELRANLNVHVTSPSTIVFKLDNISLEETNGLRDCEHDEAPSFPPQYSSPISQFPFAVENGLLVFNAEEEQRTINFYKSIVSLFSIAPLKDAFYGTSKNHSYSAAYDTTEDTVMGKCRNTYTQHKLTGVAAAQRELFVDNHVTEDVQADSLGDLVSPGSSKTAKTTGGRKNSAGPRRRRRATKTPPSKTSKKTPRVTQRAPAISNTLWEVVRSVNLEDCEDRVEHQLSLGDIYRLLTDNQNLFSRNSHGVYYLRGDENGMRLEKAMIKGAIVISPYGFETEHIVTITKQILGLVSVNHLDIDAPSLAGDSTVTTDKLVYELTLPYEDVENNNYRWAKMSPIKGNISAPTGQKEEHVINMLNNAANLAASGNSASTQQAPVLLNYVSLVMYNFNKEEITRVATGIHQGSRELFYGVLAEVGTIAAADVMLNFIGSGQISAFRQVIYFASLNMNLKSAAVLRPVLNFLKTENLDETPFKTSQSLINFASLVKRLCRSDDETSFKHFAYQSCLQDSIVTDLQEYLITELQRASQFWKQMVLAQALVNLQTVEATNALLPFVLGARECDTMVRALAMDSLANWNAASPLYQSKIVLILLEIFENPAENRLLRARALGYLASWELSSTQWTRLAFTTKRHGLKDLAALTYSLIKSTTESEYPALIQQRQYARHALSLAKPSSAADRYSSYRTWYNYNFDSHVGHIRVIKDPVSPLPAELAVVFQHSLEGAVFFKKLDFMIANDNGDLEDIANELFLGKIFSDRDDSTRGRWTNVLNMFKTDLNIEEKVRTAIRGLANVVGTVQTQLFVPFERVMLVDAMKSISGDRAPYLHLEGPSSLYINPVDNTYTTVNDLGLPVIINVARPSIVTFRGSTGFSNSGPDKYSLESDSLGVVASSFFRVNTETMIPWSRSTVAAGVYHTVTVNLPFSPQVEISWNPSTSIPSSIILELAPSVFTQTTLLTKVNMPYTYVRDEALIDLDGLMQALKVIHKDGEKGTKYQETVGLRIDPLQETSDSDFTLRVGAEDGRLQTSTGLLITLENLALFPTLMFYNVSIPMDCTGYERKSVRLNLTTATADRLPNAGKLVSKYGQDSFQDYELCGQEDTEDPLTQQTGQQSSDDYMYGQSSQSVQGPEFERFGSFGQQQAQVPVQLYDPPETETVRPSQGIGDFSQPQLSSFISYLQQQAGWKSWVNGRSVRVELLMGGATTFAVEAVAAETKCYALANQVQQKMVLAIATPMFTVCFESEVTRPKINDLDTLSGLLAKNLNLTRKTEIFTGAKCSDGPIQSIIAKQELTAAKRQNLFEKLEDLQKCSSHRGRPLNIVKEFVKTAEYDRYEYSTNFTQF